MKKKKGLKITLIIVGVLLILLITVPLFITIDVATGLSEPKEMVSDGSAIVTIPFDGTDGIDIYYEYIENNSSDKTFILLHGSMYNSKTWNEVMDYFAEKGSVYAYDQIPYGFSEKLLENDWTGENPYTTESAIIQLKSFMDEMGIDSATLVGSSFGGVIAADAAIRYKDSVDALILVDPAIFTSEEMPTWMFELKQVDNLGPAFAAMLSEGDTFYQSTFYNKSLLTEERMAYNKRETQINNWNFAMWEYLKAWSTEASTVSERLDEITQDVLVISGSEDAVVPIEDSEKIANAILHASFKVIEDCGHLPQEECTEKFIFIIDEWLDSIED